MSLPGELHCGPQPWWQLAFLAPCASISDNHWLDDIEITTGTPVAHVPVPVSVALNGQQYGGPTDSLAYTYDTSKSPPPPPPPPPPSNPLHVPPAQLSHRFLQIHQEEGSGELGSEAVLQTQGVC